MTSIRSWLFATIALLLGTNLMVASNYQVGGCEPHLQNYTSISAAVLNVPPGSTILVCPGTYAEQITISQPLTLKGVTSGNSSDVVITLPPGGSGLIGGTDDFGFTEAAFVTISAGPVNISNITVDGSGANVVENWLIGILYLDGSSGTVKEATLRHFSCSSCDFGSVGVWAEGSSSANAVTIENSSFHDIDNSSVVGYGNNLLTVKGNTMEATYVQIQWLPGGGSITGNVMKGGQGGVVVESPGTISGNTISAMSSGLFDQPGALGGGLSVINNKISDAQIGISIFANGDSFKSNTITNVKTAMEFNCYAPTVSSNTINDATTGFDQVPTSFSGTNSFTNVPTIMTDGCGASSPARQASIGRRRPGKPILPPAK
jgi:hypothetical protein